MRDGGLEKRPALVHTSLIHASHFKCKHKLVICIYFKNVKNNKAPACKKISVHAETETLFKLLRA